MAFKLKSAFNFGEGTGSSKIKKTQQDIEAQAAQDVAMDSGALPKSAFHSGSGSYVKPGGKATGSMKDYAIGSDARKKEYDARGWKDDETIKGYNKDGTKKTNTTNTTKKEHHKKENKGY